MAMFVPKDRKSLFRQFLAGMYDAVVITDPNGHVLEVNPRAAEHFGYQEDEVADRHISYLIPGLSPDVVQRIRKGLSDERHILIDANGKTKAGEKFASEVTVSVIDLMDPGDLVFTIRNVERRRELMNSLRLKAVAFRISQAALFGCDSEGVILDCNDAFCMLFGLGGAEEAKHHVYADFFSSEEHRKNFGRALAGETVCAEGLVLSPNFSGRKIVGVVGSFMKA